MTREEIISHVTPLLKGKILVKSITDVNHKPHPYVIGPGHIRNNVLDKEEIRRLEKKGVYCYHKGCTTSFDNHTSDTVLFLQLTCNLLNEEAKEILMPVMKFIEANGIDGICFVDTPQKYRIS